MFLEVFWIGIVILGIFGLIRKGGSGCLYVFLLLFILFVAKSCWDYEKEEQERKARQEEAFETIRKSRERYREHME